MNFIKGYIDLDLLADKLLDIFTEECDLYRYPDSINLCDPLGETVIHATKNGIMYYPPQPDHPRYVWNFQEIIANIKFHDQQLLNPKYKEK